jgi:hypothetical protein
MDCNDREGEALAKQRGTTTAASWGGDHDGGDCGAGFQQRLERSGAQPTPTAKEQDA